VTSKHYAIQWKSTVKEDGMTKKLAGHVIWFYYWMPSFCIFLKINGSYLEGRKLCTYLTSIISNQVQKSVKLLGKARICLTWKLSALRQVDSTLQINYEGKQLANKKTIYTSSTSALRKLCTRASLVLYKVFHLSKLAHTIPSKIIP
jgi:hypothetical protein